MRFAMSRSMDILCTDFKTQWFITIMGTGMCSNILLNFAYPAFWLRVCGHVMFGACSVCLLLSLLSFLGTFIRSPDRRYAYFHKAESTPYLACLVMGFTSWVADLSLVIGDRSPILLYVLWWIVNILSLASAWVIPFCFMGNGSVKLKDLSATFLLPLVTLTVASSCGAAIAPVLPEKLQLSTTIICFLLWANAVTLSFIFVTIYVHRLMFHHFPPKTSIFTSFIPIGFLGQGAFAILLCGRSFKDMWNGEVEGVIISWICLLSALFLLSMGIFATLFALASVLSYGRQKFHYGWWAMTFPLGTMSQGMRQAGLMTRWQTLTVVGAIYGTLSVCITILCLGGSAYQVFRWSVSVPTDDKLEEVMSNPSHLGQ